jgi:hypothetical protein
MSLHPHVLTPSTQCPCTPVSLHRAPNVLPLHVLAPISLRSEFPTSREKFPVFPEQGHPNLLMLRRDQPRRHPKKGQIRPNFTNSLVNSPLAGNCGRRKHKRGRNATFNCCDNMTHLVRAKQIVGRVSASRRGERHATAPARNPPSRNADRRMTTPPTGDGPMTSSARTGRGEPPLSRGRKSAVADFD